MKLSLDHLQRMNLSALLGVQKANVGEMRVYWRLQDRLDLSADEKAEIGYYEAGNGHAMPGWNPLLKLAPRDFDLTEAEATLISGAVESWQFTVSDRAWLESLLAQMPESPGKPRGSA